MSDAAETDHPTRTMEVQTHAVSPGQPSVWGDLDIIEEIGQGGFGRVYRAWDSTLEREVALKLFHSATRSQALRTEGRQLAKLRHPNVVQVYGVAEHGGQVGLWMELVRGRTLSRLVRDQGRLGAHEAIAIMLEVCRAVSAVHATGLIHRDIKAQNVIREEDGRIVLMDFGLTGPVSGQGALAGTPVCMAPELLRGEAASVSSDIYAIGVLLYFLVTGSYPYETTSLSELMRQQLEGKARLLADARQDLPREFVAIAEKAIAPLPANRFATAGEMAKALSGADWVQAPVRPAPNRRWGIATLCLLTAAGLWSVRERVTAGFSSPRTIAVAVLPFDNLTGNPANDYIGNGIGEEVADWLGKSRELRVISRNSSNQFRSSTEAATVIGRKLNADWLVSGSVRRDGQRVRVRVQMVQSSDGVQKLSHTYEYDVNNPFLLEEQIGGALTSLLRVRLFPNLEKLNPEARELFWQAEEEGRQQSPQSLRRSAQMLERVARMAPRNPQPLFQLASNYVSLAAFAGGTVDDGEKAKAYLRQAISIAPDVADGHRLQGFISGRLSWDWTEAEKEYKISAQLKGSGEVGYASLLLDEGRLEEARAQLDLAAVTDPLDYQIPHIRSLVELFGGNFGQAERENEAALRLMPANPTRLWRRGQIRSLLGRHEEAIDDLRRAVDLTGSRLYQGALGWACARAGQRREARSILARISVDPSISAAEPAQIYVGLGENEAAMDWLEKATNAHDPVLDTIWMDPFWKPLHGRARYQAVVGKVFRGVRLIPPPNAPTANSAAANSRRTR